MMNTPPLRPSYILESPDETNDLSCLTPNQDNMESPFQK